jgi:hypothetical protein
VFEADGFDLRTDLGELERVLDDHRPALLVLDSFRSLWGGKENDSGVARAGGRDPKDRTVGRVLDDLVTEGEAERFEEGWQRGRSSIGGGHPVTLSGKAHGRAENDGGNPPATLSTLPPANGWSPEEEAAFVARALELFPGSYELPRNGRVR